jgi:hypothetical protein
MTIRLDQRGENRSQIHFYKWLPGEDYPLTFVEGIFSVRYWIDSSCALSWGGLTAENVAEFVPVPVNKIHLLCSFSSENDNLAALAEYIPTTRNCLKIDVEEKYGGNNYDEYVAIGKPVYDVII